ncbi:MAG: hypothetical protein IPO08_25095 [Xanthomonadales bacterium]|jgi:hypothetical protein|nr:hypothetical protein [Xanthomonadales bacterium]
MSDDVNGIRMDVEFFWLSKYEGDRSARDALPPLPDDVYELRKLCERLQGELYGLRADLTDPQCVEIVAGGDSLAVCNWRK